MHVQSISADVGLEHGDVRSIGRIYKKVMREVSYRVRQEITVGNRLDGLNLMGLLSAKARAVFWNDRPLAATLISTSPLAAEHLEVRSGRVCCYSQTAFDQVFRSFHCDHLEERIQELSRDAMGNASICLQKQLQSRIKAARRQKQICWPIQRRMRLNGVTVFNPEGGEVKVESPSGIQAALVNYWQPVYAPSACDEEKANTFLGIYCRQQGHKLHYDQVTLPDLETLEQNIRRAKHSATGTDGIPQANP